MGMSMFNMPNIGMHDVDTRWNGMSVSYEVTESDQYGYENVKMKNETMYEMKMPNGLLHRPNDEQVVPLIGAVDHSLPPFKTSTGLRAPNMTNPYLNQRDASYVYDNDYHASETHGMFPTYEMSSEPVPQDNFAPESFNEPWQLGENDLLSMFNDYYHDGYVAELDTAMEKAKQFTRVENEMDGLFNPNCKEAFNMEPYILSEFEQANHRDSWMNYTFQQTRASEEWQPNELHDITYHWLHEACTPANTLPADVNLAECSFEWASEPELIMATDAMGKSTPMACGVMVVKSIEG